MELEKLNRDIISLTELLKQKLNVTTCQGGRILVDYPGLQKENKYTIEEIDQSSKILKQTLKRHYTDLYVSGSQNAEQKFQNLTRWGEKETEIPKQQNYIPGKLELGQTLIKIEKLQLCGIQVAQLVEGLIWPRIWPLGLWIQA